MSGSDKSLFPLRIPNEVIEKVAAEAKAIGVSKTAYILMMLQKGMKSA